MTDFQNRVVQALKNLIYKGDDFDLDLLQKFIGKKIGDKFYKLKDIYKTVPYDQEMEDWAMDIITNMLAGDAFINNWKTEHPDPDGIDTRELFKKFKNKIEKQIDRIYEKYVGMRREGFCDCYELPTDDYQQPIPLEKIGRKKRSRPVLSDDYEAEGEDGFIEDEVCIGSEGSVYDTDEDEQEEY